MAAALPFPFLPLFPLFLASSEIFSFQVSHVQCLVSQLCLTLCNPWSIAHQAPLSMEILQARILEWVAGPSSRGSSQPRDQIQVFRIAARFFTVWATGKPKITGVGSLSLLQGIFPTQESNQGLLHCRQILYQLSYQGSLLFKKWLSLTQHF